jgi:diguanylate cyclase (GGDEF)-like protein/PAS domain S-box-containing protein
MDVESNQKRIVIFATSLVILVGCITLLSWQKHISLVLYGFLSQASTMKANAAFCFVLSGISLGLLDQVTPQRWSKTLHQRRSQWRHIIGVGAALGVAIIGGLTLIEYIFHWNLGIDQLLVQDQVISSTTIYPGRMGENVAFNFVLVGSTLILLSKNICYYNWLLQITSCIVAVIALLALIGYLFGANILYSFVVRTTSMAPHTAVTFIVLCVGILFSRSHQGLMRTFTSPLLGGVIARQLFPWLIALSVFPSWLIYKGYQFSLYDAALSSALEVVVSIVLLSILVYWSAWSLNQLEERRQELENNFRFAIMESPLPTILHAENGEVILINGVWTEITGYTASEISTIADWTERAYGKRQKIIQGIIDRLYSINCRVAEGEFTILTKSGSKRVWDFFSAPLGKTKDGRRLVITTAIDVTKRKQVELDLRQINETLEIRVAERTKELAQVNQRLVLANKKLQLLAHTDRLTRVANRYCFDKYLDEQWYRIGQQQGYIALILFDVDYFKSYNDTYGHPAGDLCLVNITRAVKRAVRGYANLLARYGGEEFAVILPNCDHAEVLRIVQAIREQVKKLNIPHACSTVSEILTVSLGIAITYPSLNSSPQDLIDKADKALYQAKQGGRNCYKFIIDTNLGKD